jgi:hypothetical protein
VTRSLDGLRFAPVADPEGGEVGTTTLFRYREHDGVIWADYDGGRILRGHLVGTRDGDRLDFRYVQLTRDGGTSSGHCVSRVVALPDGRLRLEETWQWESRPGAGTSTVEELPHRVTVTA